MLTELLKLFNLVAALYNSYWVLNCIFVKRHRQDYLVLCGCTVGAFFGWRSFISLLGG